MKKLLAIIILSLYLITPSQSDDIRDFQIEGMSVGDSLLDYFNESEIKKNSRSPWPNKKTYYHFSSRKNFNKYDAITAAYLINDNNYKIHEVTGRQDINYKKCQNQMKEISLEIESIFNSARKDDKGEKNHRGDKTKKSKIKIINFWLNDGSIIHIGCYKWSKKMNNKDGLNIALGSSQFVEWQKNKAFK